jgi:hypothetical protein
MLTRRFSCLYRRWREARGDRRQTQNTLGRYRSDPAPAQNFVPSLYAVATCCARGGVKRLPAYGHRICGHYVFPANPPKPRGHERTRTAVLSSSHVIIHVLQGFARTCKAGIFRRFSFLRLALCCTVVRSRWCQSSVRGSYHLSDWWAGVD